MADNNKEMPPVSISGVLFLRRIKLFVVYNLMIL
jgi:hypothetical protein